jgi:hypothetical protein
MWFVQLTDKANEIVHTRHGRSVKVCGGTVAQYQWKDTDGRVFWHVRERFFARDVKSIAETPAGEICIEFKSSREAPAMAVPEHFEYIIYAYHLTDKAADAASPMGFLEFFGKEGQSLQRIDNKWIFLEAATHSTDGTYPKIRMRVERSDLQDVLVTSSCVILRGPMSRSIPRE